MIVPALRSAPDIVPGGVLAFIAIAEAQHDDARLEPAERALAATVSPVRRGAFVAGRVALRAAVHAVSPGMSHAPLLRTGRGAPLLPHGVSGSVSHKRLRAVAIAAPHPDARVGVDLEERPGSGHGHRRHDGRALARRILTPRELDLIAALDDERHHEATLLLFSLKEAVYKAIDPFVERYVRFTEVEIETPVGNGRDEGTGEVRLMLPECEGAPIAVRVAWSLEPDWIVTVAVARPL